MKWGGEIRATSMRMSIMGVMKMTSTARLSAYAIIWSFVTEMGWHLLRFVRFVSSYPLDTLSLMRVFMVASRKCNRNI